MNKQFSVYLDAVRFFAAFVVFASHLAYERFTEGRYLWIRELNLGSDAVVIFFVLSGFLIAHSIREKDASYGRYVFNRMTRLYSVVFPALILTFVFDAIGRGQESELYVPPWYMDLSLPQILVHGLSFSNEFWFAIVRLGSNGPLWSLSYEFMYYMIFGVYVFMRGFERIGLILLLCLISGPAILMLMPIWFMGVLVYSFTKNHVFSLSRFYALVLTLVPLILYMFFLTIKLPDFLMQLTLLWFGEDVVASVFRFSDEFIWNAIIGVLFGLHLFGAYHLCLLRQESSEKAVSRFIRWLAGGSFTLYVVHYPALMMMQSFAIWEGLTHDLYLCVSVLVICYLCAAFSERQLGPLRRLLQKTIPSKKAQA